MSQVNRASPDTERSLPAVAALRWPTKIATSAKEKIDRVKLMIGTVFGKNNKDKKINKSCLLLDLPSG